MRAYEQIRNNLSLLSHTHEVNVNLIGVGAGLSYDVSGPTHHCVEDISVMRTLPNIAIFSPSDWALTERFVSYSIDNKRPKYLRFDSKPLPNIYGGKEDIDFQKGFFELSEGNEVCLVTTGYMTHSALSVVKSLGEDGINIGLVDFFLLKPFNEDILFEILNKYKYIITLEEAFINKGGMDSVISAILNNKRSNIKLRRMGLGDLYVFDIGNREHLHKINKLDKESIIKSIKEAIEEVYA
jgi:transketolase